MNRSAKQLTLFDGAADYQLFLQVMKEAERRWPIRLLEYCLMPNHFHLLLWPETDKQLSGYMRWVAGVHAQRWRRGRGTIGKWAVYQGRFKWVAVQDGRHYSIARRYIWQNPVRARFVDQPEVAISQADELIGEVMQARGYPVADFDRRVADVSVDHAGVVEHYRTAHAIASEQTAGIRDTEELRQAMVHYRALFEDLLEVEPRADDDRAPMRQPSTPTAARRS